MSAIAGAELGKNVRDAAFHCRLRNEEQVRDLLVGITGSNQLQDLNFAGAQLAFPEDFLVKHGR